MGTNTANDVFMSELQKLYHIENHLVDFQTDLANEVSDSELSNLLSEHQGTSHQQIERLEGVFRTLDVDPQEQESPTMEGILAEHESASDIQDGEVRDAIDLGIAMGIERLEITSLETLQRLARKRELPSDVIEALEMTRREAEDGLQRMHSLSSS